MQKQVEKVITPTWFEDTPEPEEEIEAKKLPKKQLNSGGISDELHEFYLGLARRRGKHISEGVAEALEMAMPAMAKKYGIDRCWQCHANIDPKHVFCWNCGTRITSA